MMWNVLSRTFRGEGLSVTRGGGRAHVVVGFIVAKRCFTTSPWGVR